jgi:hypothetical protein
VSSESHTAIHGAGVDIDITQPGGQEFAQGTLAGPRRTVDGDDQFTLQDWKSPLIVRFKKFGLSF